MSKGIIIYKSKYGATEKYAKWLAEESGFSTVELKDAEISEIVKYDTVIFGGGIYASGIAGISFLKKNISLLKGKEIIAFCVGASPYDKEAFSVVKSRNMNNELRDVPLYYCRGSWNIDDMKFVDKALCKMLSKAVLKKQESELEPWEKALVQAGDKNADWTDKCYLEPILNSIK